LLAIIVCGLSGLNFYKVPTVVNNSRNHGVECIEPLDQFEKRQKASGISRFFAPAQKSSKADDNTPSAATPSTGSGKTAAASPSSTVSTVAADADVDSFFNTKGQPGTAFASRINPADPGQTTGDQHTATTEPSTHTSDAAELAEAFVRQVKGESSAEGSSSSDVHMKESDEESTRKRKHETDAEVKIEAHTEERDTKRHKPTAAERAHAQQQQQ
jgi:hypothetical protein